MALESLLDACWTLSAFGAAAVLFRLWREFLLNRFRILGVFLAWEVASFLFLRLSPPHTNVYAYGFFVSRAVASVLSVLVALELVNLITRHYPGIATLARRAARAALVLAVVIALASATVEFGALAAESGAYNAFSLIDRTVCVTAAVFLLAAVLFLAWFPVRVSRNVVAYALGFIVVLAAHLAALLLLNAQGTAVANILSLFEILTTVAVYAYWVFVFRHRHELFRARGSGRGA